MVMCATKKNTTRKGSREGQGGKYAGQEALQRRNKFSKDLRRVKGRTT